MKRLLCIWIAFLAFVGLAEAQVVAPTNPQTTYRDLSQPVAAGGMWRWKFGSSTATLEMNTASNGGFGTFTTYVSASSSGLITLNGALTVTGLITASGGIDIGGFTPNSMLYGGAAGSIQDTAAATNGQILIGGAGVAPSLGTLTSTANQTTVTNTSNAITLSLAGPHNFTTQTTNGILYGNGTAAIASTAQGASGTVLHGNGGVPGFSAVSLTADVSGLLPLANGGTNANLTSNNGGIFYSTATAGAILAGTATATQMLQSGATGAPAWSTSTWPATTTTSQLLYSSSTNTVVGLATANNAVLVTSAGGVPSIAATGSSLQVSSSVLNTIQGIRTVDSPSFTGMTLSGLTAGSVVYAGTGGLIAQDNANLFYDSTNKRLLLTATSVVTATAGRGYFAVKGTSDTGVLEFQTATADADGVALGIIQFSDVNASSANKRIAFISGQLSGATANDRGGNLRFFTKANAGTATETMRLTSTGGAVIGTTLISSDPGAGGLIVSGSVGIGTGAPGSPLTVSRNAANLPTPIAGVLLQLGNVDATATNMQMDGFGAGNNIIARRAGGTAASPTATPASGTLIALTGRGYGTTGYSTVTNGSFAVISAELWTDTAQGTDLTFTATPTGSITPAAYMRLKGGGRLLLGTTLPTDDTASALQVTGVVSINGNGAATAGQLDVFASGQQVARLRSIPGGAAGYIDFFDATASTRRGIVGYGNIFTGGGLTDFGLYSDAALKFATGGSAAVALTIDTSQNVTISSAGTTPLVIKGTGASGSYTTIYDSTNSLNRGFLGYGSNVAGGLSISDLALRSEGALKFLSNGPNLALTIDTSQRPNFGNQSALNTYTYTATVGGSTDTGLQILGTITAGTSTFGGLEFVNGGSRQVAFQAFRNGGNTTSGLNIFTSNAGALNTAAMTILGSGAVGISGTPTTGTLDVFGSGIASAQFRVTGAGGGYIRFYDSTNAAVRGDVGYGSNTISGAAISDFGMDSVGALKLASNGGTVGFTLDTSQGTTLAQGLQVNGVYNAGQNVAVFGSGAASTYSNVIMNGASTANYGPYFLLQSAGTAIFQLVNVGRIDGGTSTDIYLRTMGSNQLKIGTNSTTAITVDTSQNTTHVANVWAGVGSTLGFTGRGGLAATADGIFNLQNNAQSNYGTLAIATLNIQNRTFLTDDSANIAAFKNTTTAQEVRVYGTTTGPVYTRLYNDGAASHLVSFTNNALYFGVNNADKWLINNSSGAEILPITDNASDIGSPVARPRSTYVATSVNVGVATNITGEIYAAVNTTDNHINMHVADNNTATSANYLNLLRSRGTQASRSDIVNGDRIGQLTFQQYSSGIFDTAAIRGVNAGTFTTGQRPPSQMEFYTNIANGAQTLRHTLKSNGDEYFDGDSGFSFTINNSQAAKSGYTFYVGAGTSGLNGRVYSPNLTASAGLQTGVVCVSSTGELINDSIACLASSRRFKTVKDSGGLSLDALTAPHNLGSLDIDALSVVMNLQPVQFTYKNEGWDPKKADWSEHFGFFAEDVVRIEPRLVNFEHDGVTARGFQYDMYTAVLTRAMQQQENKIEELEKRVHALEAR